MTNEWKKIKRIALEEHNERERIRALDKTKKGYVGVSKAPKNTSKKKEWVEQMQRIQIAMWIDGKSKCLHCNHIYQSVDDFLSKKPRMGFTKTLSFVCDLCFNEYVKTNKSLVTKI